LKRLLTFLGTRPEIIKLSPLIPRFDQGFAHALVHSGQHYSPNMDEIFFRELGLRRPDAMLGCGGLPPAEQVGLMMQRLEKLMMENMPDAVVVQGDTNTALAGALAAAKHKEAGVKLIHIEAGCRSGNPAQTEEINRLLIDRVSDLMFAPTPADAANLAREGIDASAYSVTGNTVVDSCRRTAALVDDAAVLGRHGLASGGYCLATLHRQETVDHRERLAEVAEALDAIADRLPVVLPLHPRTAGKMAGFGLAFGSAGVRIIEPAGYLELIGLLKHARFCLTDSGGMQEEAVVLRVPALVLRNETEYMHYVRAGALRLAGTSRAGILEAAGPLLDGEDEGRRIRALQVDLPADCSGEIARRLAAFLG
jgi:UDP-N-acetylglucosamine 2-epimerase (non-hydrolysing)